MKVCINRKIALGNGTRPKRFVVAESTATSVDQLRADNCQLCEGVAPVELQVLLDNPGLIMTPDELAVDDTVEINGLYPRSTQQSEAGPETDPFKLYLAGRKLADDGMPGMTADQLKPFEAAGHVTALDVYKHADKHNGSLSGIKGVGQKIESAMLGSLARLMEAFEGMSEPPTGDPDGQGDQDPTT